VLGGGCDGDMVEADEEEDVERGGPRAGVTEVVESCWADEGTVGYTVRGSRQQFRRKKI